jgi:DNA polymerase III subunit delta'
MIGSKPLSVKKKSTSEADPDQLEGAPHPRDRHVLFGQEEAEQEFLRAFASGRLHHAWLIGGPQGIGKATLAYRIARFVLAQGAGSHATTQSLEISSDTPVARQVAAFSHPNLFVLRRQPATEKKVATSNIPVDQVRRALGLFATTAGDSGYRICIVDSAEDLAAPSANALLKMVEEPPPRSLFLIISHAPQRVLPTIRSRCRRLMLSPLGEGDLTSVIGSLGDETFDPADVARAVALADGSARRAIELLDPAKAETIEAVNRLLDGLPRFDVKASLAVAERLSKKGSEQDFELALESVQRWASLILNRKATEGPARLAPLVEVCEKIARSAREVDIYNLDRRPLVLTMFGDLADAVRATE